MNKSVKREFLPEINNEYFDILNDINEYQEYSNLIKERKEIWIDNGLRVCSRVKRVPKDSKEKELILLENELSNLLKDVVKYPQYYQLKWRIASKG